MSDITISDGNASVTLHVKDDAIKLSALQTGVASFTDLLNDPLGMTKFNEASFQAKLAEPKIDLGGNRCIVVKEGENCNLHVLRDADKCLFPGDACDPVNIEKGDQWMSFQVSANLDAAGSLPIAPGFGVSVEVTAQPLLTTYTRFPKSNPDLTLMDACGETISNFAVLRSGADICAVKADTVHVCDLTGSMKLGGSFSFPLACNQLSLADEKLPFNEKVQLSPALKMTVSGAVTLSGEFGFRVRRTDAKTVQIGLYKKRSTTLSAGFTAGAGLVADLGTTDLIAALFGAVAPNVDTKPAAIPAGDAEQIKKAIKESLASNLSIGVNVACSAAMADEAAVLFAVDVTTNLAATTRALDLALRGDWTELAACPNAITIRNAITDTVTSGATFRVNVLGVYNYESTEEFLRSSTLLHADDGSITITDKVRADWIAVASAPYLADAKRLRLALHQGFLATATWKALHTGARLDASFAAQQDVFVYQQEMSPHVARKNLLTGVFLGVAPENLISQVPARDVLHARFAATAQYTNDAVLKLFLTDIESRTPREEHLYVNLGRATLAALLDSTYPTDQARQLILRSDAEWNNLTEPTGATYSDWYDVTMWSSAFAAVGPALRDALKAADACVGDPTKDGTFMKKREQLAHVMAHASKQLHAAYERGWPLALCVALSGARSKSVAVTFEAAWDGQKIFSTPASSEAAHAGMNQ